MKNMAVALWLAFLTTCLGQTGASAASFASPMASPAALSAAKVQPVFLPLPPGAVSPEGWLRDWALDAASGITGHLDEYAATYREAWKGQPFTARGALPDGTGWPLEQCSYWLDGALRLGFMLQDQRLIDKVKGRLDGVVSGVLRGGQSFIWWRPKAETIGKQVEGGEFNSWAHSQMGRALVAYYQATGDPRILQALVKVYRDFPLSDMEPSFLSVSGALNLDAMLDTYLMSGDRQILDRALEYSRRPAYRALRRRWMASRFEPGHNVIFYEDIRLPALLYPWTGDPDDLAATERAIVWNDQHQLLPMGLSSGEEFHAGVGATRNVETCNVAASIWTYLHLLRSTGEGGYADRIEQIFFNAGPAPVARDFKTMCYYQSPNRYGASLPKEEPTSPGPECYRFTPTGHSVLCCVGNLNRVIPNYVMFMWMATEDKGIAAALYGPATLRASVAGGVQTVVESETAYPFEDSVRLTLQPERAAAFPLYLRVPGWCSSAEIKVNGQRINLDRATGSFLKIVRTWRAGDKVTLRFPMAARVATGRETPYPQIDYFAKNRSIARDTAIDSPFATVYYGPLLFALPIADLDPNHEAPNARYHYALDVNPQQTSRAIRIIRHLMPARWNWPLDAPLELSVPVKEFDWEPSEAQPLPKQAVSGGKSLRVRMVPYGCTKFRVSMLPVTEKAEQ
ncbi:MAG: beta-L-arabinofuranosidase domain-containing protein [Limisphaerales bacterium]